jgi:hypothetical protein
MVTYQTVVATLAILDAQVHQEAWAQTGVAPECVHQRCIRGSINPIQLPQKSSVRYAERNGTSRPHPHQLRARGINPATSWRRAEYGSGPGRCQAGQIWPARNPRQRLSA